MRAEIQREILARPYGVDDDEPDEQCDRRHDFEVDDRLCAASSDGLDVAGLRDPDNDRQTEQRDDESLDETDEASREERKRAVKFRVGVLGQQTAESDA